MMDRSKSYTQITLKKKEKNSRISIKVYTDNKTKSKTSTQKFISKMILYQKLCYLFNLYK